MPVPSPNQGSGYLVGLNWNIPLEAAITGGSALNGFVIRYAVMTQVRFDPLAAKITAATPPFGPVVAAGQHRRSNPGPAATQRFDPNPKDLTSYQRE